jgi:hypothetical protein
MATDRDQRLVDLEERGGWMKQTVQPNADAQPLGLPPKPEGNVSPGPAGAQGSGAQSSVQSGGQGSEQG